MNHTFFSEYASKNANAESQDFSRESDDFPHLRNPILPMGVAKVMPESLVPAKELELTVTLQMDAQRSQFCMRTVGADCAKMYTQTTHLGL